jgi:hypothetical protein
MASMTVLLADAEAVPIDLPLASVGAQPGQLPVQLVSQGNYVYLCWAACCTMLTKAYAARYPATCGGLPTNIEDVAHQVIDANACETAASLGIDQACFPDCAIQTFVVSGQPIPCSKAGPIDENDIVDQIINGRKPVIIYVWWNGQNSAHVVLISGYNSTTHLFTINDPKAHRTLSKSYTWLHDYGGSAAWWYTYYDIGYTLD